MSKKKSGKEYIKENDFEGAKIRYEKANLRWKDYWYGICEEIFNKVKELSKKYVLDPIQKTIRTKRRKSKYDEIIEENGFDISKENGELCYLFRFFDKDKNLICSKVGTTKRSIRKRIIEELTSKTYTSMGVAFASVDRVYNCKNLPAEGLESLLRAEYIKKYPNSFKKNDRFIKENFDLSYCDRLAKKYLS